MWCPGQEDERAVMGVPVPLHGRGGVWSSGPLQGAALGVGWDPEGKLSQTARSKVQGPGAPPNTPRTGHFLPGASPSNAGTCAGEEVRESLVPPQKGDQEAGGEHEDHG